MNPIGLVAALSAFMAIWLGHVAVRKIEFTSRRIWIPGAIFLSLGMILIWVSIVSPSLPISVSLGIVGLTCFWDVHEFTRQQRRVSQGHAPANPRNPRHAAFLAEPGSGATTLDVLRRETLGVATHSASGTPESMERRALPR